MEGSMYVSHYSTDVYRWDNVPKHEEDDCKLVNIDVNN